MHQGGREVPLSLVHFPFVILSFDERWFYECLLAVRGLSERLSFDVCDKSIESVVIFHVQMPYPFFYNLNLVTHNMNNVVSLQFPSKLLHAMAN